MLTSSNYVLEYRVSFIGDLVMQRNSKIPECPNCGRQAAYKRERDGKWVCGTCREAWDEEKRVESDLPEV